MQHGAVSNARAPAPTPQLALMAGPIPATMVAEAEADVFDPAAVAPDDAAPESAPQLQSLAEWLRDGEFTLALASSFFGFYAHAGALQGASSQAACFLERG